MTAWTNRHHFLVSYDVSEDDRRTAVFRACHDHGNHVQYSVFLCQLDRREAIELRQILRGLIDHATDQVMLVDLGPATHSLEDHLETIGLPYSPPGKHFVV